MAEVIQFPSAHAEDERCARCGGPIKEHWAGRRCLASNLPKDPDRLKISEAVVAFVLAEGPVILSDEIDAFHVPGPVRLSDMFLKLWCGKHEPTEELTGWLGDRRPFHFRRPGPLRRMGSQAHRHCRRGARRYEVILSIQLCSNCKAPYWRFRGDHPPKGFCQVSCRDEKKAGKKEATPPLPENALRTIMEHRREVHHSTDILAWFECAECEALEKVYSGAIEYHYDRITRELVAAGRR